MPKTATIPPEAVVFHEQDYRPRYSVRRLKVHPKNAKLGAQQTIDDSISANGFYGAVLVQKSTSYILVGNHRYKGVVAKGGKTIPVLIVDVTDEQAARIMLIDNRSSDLGTYDPQKLLALVQEVQAALPEGGLEGTGYDDSSVQAMLKRVARDAETAEDKAKRMGTSRTISYTIVFDDETQQSAWYAFVRALKVKYSGAHETTGSQLQAFLADNPGLTG